MRSQLVLTLSTVLILLTAGCLGAAQPSSADVGALETSNATISVGATAQVSAPPDLALVRVAVIATAPDADTARSQVAENASAMRVALRSMGIRDDQVRTTYFNLGAVYETTEDKREIIRYRAVHGFEIEAGVDQAGEVIDTAVMNGANQIDGVEFTLTENTRRDVRGQALGLAMENARQDADLIANASEITITGVQSASTADIGFVSFDTRFERSQTGGAPTVIEPGPVTVSVTVSVTYRGK